MKTYILSSWLCFIALITIGCSGQSKEATIKAPGDYEIRITADNQWEYQRPFYCELWLKGRQVKKPHFFGGSEGTKYELVEAKDNAAFKIVDASTRETLILVDRKTGDAWPWSGGSESTAQAEERRVHIESLFKDAEVEARNPP